MKTLLFLSTISLIYIVGCENPDENLLSEEKGNDTTQNNDTVLTENCVADTCYTCELTTRADTIFKQLLTAYEDSCVNCLQDILDEWANASVPQTNIPDSQQMVYNVYKAFYSPWDLARISNSEFGHKIYEDISYYIIQPSIDYSYEFNYPNDRSFSFPGMEGSTTIENFRPTLANDTIKLLYYDNDYISAMNCFLGTQHSEVGSGGIMNPALPISETSKRNEFIGNYLFFFPGHWGGYWHMETHPEVNVIAFNEAADSAQVAYRLGYQGGETILIKENDEWKIIDHYMTWIE